jgi:transcriptional regulator with XRE-family HTH domain
MSNISFNNIQNSPDSEILQALGEYVKHHRVQANISQTQLAVDAGISRSTLSLLERGENTSLLSFIQILRVLRQLHALAGFEIEETISPMEILKGAGKQSKNPSTPRQRATPKGGTDNLPNKPTTEW